MREVEEMGSKWGRLTGHIHHESRRKDCWAGGGQQKGSEDEEGNAHVRACTRAHAHTHTVIRPLLLFPSTKTDHLEFMLASLFPFKYLLLFFCLSSWTWTAFPFRC